MTGDEVAIAGRLFTIGGVYAARRGLGPGRHRPRRLLSHDPGSVLRGGRVTVALVPSGNLRIMSGEQWAAWAGEEVRE